MASKKSKKSGASPVASKRNYLLSAEQLEKLREEWKADGGKKSRPPNPYRSGTYRAIVAALIELGVNGKGHPFTAVKREVKRLMSSAETRVGEGDDATTAWERFAGREARNEETGKDVDGRLKTNIEVLQRTGDYAAKMIQAGKEILGSRGMSIDTLPGDLIRLSTDSDTPERELRRPRKNEPIKTVTKQGKPKPSTARAAKAKPAKAAKASKPKAKSRMAAAKDAADVVAQPVPENSDLGQATANSDFA